MLCAYTKHLDHFSASLDLFLASLDLFFVSLDSFYHPSIFFQHSLLFMSAFSLSFSSSIPLILLASFFVILAPLPWSFSNPIYFFF
ncbi:hypothetical protein BKA57DRAFT_449228, partial [Linnemannia elongata]